MILFHILRTTHCFPLWLQVLSTSSEKRTSFNNASSGCLHLQTTCCKLTLNRLPCIWLTHSEYISLIQIFPLQADCRYRPTMVHKKRQAFTERSHATSHACAVTEHKLRNLDTSVFRRSQQLGLLHGITWHVCLYNILQLNYTNRRLLVAAARPWKSSIQLWKIIFVVDSHLYLTGPVWEHSYRERREGHTKTYLRIIRS